MGKAFNAHASTSDLDFVMGDYEKDMEDILPNSYIADSVLLNRNSLKNDIKTDDYGRMLIDLFIYFMPVSYFEWQNPW